jgi:hypothetical protein
MWSALRPTVSSRSTMRVLVGSARWAPACGWSQRLADDRAHRHARVQRGVRVLEDDLHVARSARSSSLPAVVTLLAVEADLAFGGLDQAQDAARPVVLLPQPDSPTTPSVSPATGRSSRRRPHARGRPRAAGCRPLIGKCLTRFLTCSSGAAHRTASPGSRPPCGRGRSRSGGCRCCRHRHGRSGAAGGEAAALGRGSISLGTVPGMASSRTLWVAARSMRGIERIRPWV